MDCRAHSPEGGSPSVGDWARERTFGWLNRFRRLSKDYEVYSEVSEAMIYGTLLRLMVRRLAA